MSALELWALFVLLPGVNHAAPGLALLFMFASIGAFAGKVFADPASKDSAERTAARLGRFWPAAVIGFVCSISLAIAAPSERQVYTLVGGYVATNIEGVENLPENMVKAANAFLERVAEEQGND